MRLVRQGAFLTVGALSALVCAAMVAGHAAAARGVSVDLGRIEIEQTLSPGGSYQLPTMGVRNPGDEAASYAMAVTPIDGVNAPGREWVRFSPGQVTLQPAETSPVQMRLSIPTDAEPGRYAALVGAEIVDDEAGARVGAAAAARLTFEVEPSSALDAWWRRLRTFFDEYSPWSYLVVGLLFGLAALASLRRRFRITVARRT